VAAAAGHSDETPAPAPEQMKQHKAAMRIQSAHRAKVAKRKVACIRAENRAAIHFAAVKIQSAQRRKVARRRVDEIRSAAATAAAAVENKAAIRIQSAQRAKFAKRRVEVGPGRYCPPRHSTHCDPSDLELNVIL
jgi:hypothetical protein